jgi:hypothetical protein
VAYDANMIDNYDHLQGAEKRAHEGSQSMGHMAGGDAGYSVAMGGKGNSYGAKENDPGGATPGKIGKSKKGSMPEKMGNHRETKGPGGMDM